MRISDWSSDVCSSDLPAATKPASASPAAPPLKRRAIVGLLVDDDRARMMLGEVLLDDPKVTRVRAKEEVEGVADERHRAERGIDAEIADHAPDLPFRHTEVARFPDQIGAHRRRDHVADDGDEADDGVEADGEIGRAHV